MQYTNELHESSVQVLEKTGIHIDHEEGEALLLQNGATKDLSGRILISSSMVEKALNIVDRNLFLWNRDGTQNILLTPGSTYFGPGSDALYNVDKLTGEIRRSTLVDLRENVTIADFLPEFKFVMSMALPEVSPERLYAIVFAEMVQHTSKSLVVTATNLHDIEQIYNIACVVAGGADELEAKPFFIAYLEPISPLRLERSIVDRVLFCASHRIPMLFAAGANCGTGAPVTIEGGVVQGNAECLAGLVLASLKNPKVRFIYGANTSSVDMRSMIVCYGSPEWFKSVTMYAKMGKHYALPSWGTAGCSDATCIDAQAAMEAYEGILMALQSGSTLVHDVGYLGHGTLYDARMLVLTNDMICRARHLLRSVDVSEEVLAVNIIDEVAREGSLYLAHPHTLRHFRDALWIPPLYFYRKEDVQGTDINVLLREEVQRILSIHKPQMLPLDKVNKINKVLDS